MEMMRPPPDVVAELAALAARLGADYADRFRALGGSFECWRNSRSFGIESRFLIKGHGPGPMWSTSEKFGRLSGWPFKRWEPVGSIADLEAKLRSEIEAFLDRGKPARAIGNPRLAV
jgi:hypothetical protein